MEYTNLKDTNKYLSETMNKLSLSIHDIFCLDEMLKEIVDNIDNNEYDEATQMIFSMLFKITQIKPIIPNKYKLEFIKKFITIHDYIIIDKLKK